jgi:hypothetical protein
MVRFLFFILVERHGAAGHASSRPWAAPVSAL